MSDTVKFLGIRFDRMNPEEAVEILEHEILRRQTRRVFYANAHTMVTASKNPELTKALEQSDWLLADGSGVRWGSALLGTPLVHNLNGTDLVPALCQSAATKGLSIYLLGGKPGVADEAAANLQKAYPGLIIAGTRNGYYKPEELPQVLEEIRQAKPHLLLVAMGVPLQEIWIDKYADELPGICCMGVGGLFDFLAKRVPRAPKIFRATGMEWCWRLMMEPGRLWKRYLIGNLVFFNLIVNYAVSNSFAKPATVEVTEEAIELPLHVLTFPADGALEMEQQQLVKGA